MKNLNIILATLIATFITFNISAQDLSEYTLFSHHSLLGTTQDLTGTTDSVELINAPLDVALGAYSYGGYPWDTHTEDSSLILSPKLSVLYDSLFAVQFEFMVDSLDDRRRPVITIGESWRYLGLMKWEDNTFRILLNGSYKIAGEIQVEAGRWYTYTVTWSSRDSLSKFYLDNQMIYSANEWLSRSDNDDRLSNLHGGSGTGFRGYLRNIKTFASKATNVDQVVYDIDYFDVWPNPVFEQLNISINHTINNNKLLILTDLQGNSIRRINIEQNRFSISNLVPGMYVATLYDGLVPLQSKQIIVLTK